MCIISVVVFKVVKRKATMESDLAPDISLMSEIIDYLSLRDVARCRPTNRLVKRASEQRYGAWRVRVKRACPDVRDCGVCSALIRTRGPLNTLYKAVEWCGLCDRIVCVDHLRRCHVCASISCSACVCC